MASTGAASLSNLKSFHLGNRRRACSLLTVRNLNPQIYSSFKIFPFGRYEILKSSNLSKPFCSPAFKFISTQRQINLQLSFISQQTSSFWANRSSNLLFSKNFFFQSRRFSESKNQQPEDDADIEISEEEYNESIEEANKEPFTAEELEEFEEELEAEDAFDVENFPKSMEEFASNLFKEEKEFHIPDKKGDFELATMKKYAEHFESLAKEGNYEKLEEFYNKSKNESHSFQDTVSYNMLLADLVEKQKYSEIPEVVKEMNAQGILCDEITQSYIKLAAEQPPTPPTQPETPPTQPETPPTQPKKDPFEELKKEIEKFEEQK